MTPFDPNYHSPSAVSPSSYNIQQYLLSNIVQQAYRLAGGLLFAGQGINASEQSEILDITNHMVDGLKLEALFFQFQIRTIFQVVAGQHKYAVGPGQQWDIERWEKINSAGFIIEYGQSESEIPMYVVADYEDYKNIVAKLTQSTIPLLLYYQATVPYGTATLWPVPNASSSDQSGARVAIYSPGMMQEFSSLDDPFVVAHGYREFFIYELATRIHEMPPYSKQPMSPSVMQRAILYKERIRDAQLTPLYASSDRAAMAPTHNGILQPPRAWSPYN